MLRDVLHRHWTTIQLPQILLRVGLYLRTVFPFSLSYVLTSHFFDNSIFWTILERLSVNSFVNYAFNHPHPINIVLDSHWNVSVFRQEHSHDSIAYEPHDFLTFRWQHVLLSQNISIILEIWKQLINLNYRLKWLQLDLRRSDQSNVLLFCVPLFVPDRMAWQ